MLYLSNIKNFIFLQKSLYNFNKRNEIQTNTFFNLEIHYNDQTITTQSLNDKDDDNKLEILGNRPFFYFKKGESQELNFEEKMHTKKL